jgi:hypothetical protein
MKPLALSPQEFEKRRDALFKNLHVQAKPLHNKTRDICSKTWDTLGDLVVLMRNGFLFLFTYFYCIHFFGVFAGILIGVFASAFLFVCTWFGFGLIHALIKKLVWTDKLERLSYSLLNAHCYDFDQDFGKHPLLHQWLTHPEFRQALLRWLSQQEEIGLREQFILETTFRDYLSLIDQLGRYIPVGIEKTDWKPIYDFHEKEKKLSCPSISGLSQEECWAIFLEEAHAARERQQLDQQTVLPTSSKPNSPPRRL